MAAHLAQKVDDPPPSRTPPLRPQAEEHGWAGRLLAHLGLEAERAADLSVAADPFVALGTIAEDEGRPAGVILTNSHKGPWRAVEQALAKGAQVVTLRDGLLLDVPVLAASTFLVIRQLPTQKGGAVVEVTGDARDAQPERLQREELRLLLHTDTRIFILHPPR